MFVYQNTSEESLKSIISEEFITGVFDAISDCFEGGAFVTDSDGTVFKSNAHADEFLGKIGFTFELEVTQKFVEESKEQIIKNLGKTIQEQIKTSFEVALVLEGILRKIQFSFSPIHSSKLALGLIKQVVESENEAELYKQVLDKLPADIALFDDQLNYKFVNKSAVKNDNVRQWLIGRSDYDYCRMRNISEKIAEERTSHLKKVKEAGFLEFIETFAGPSSTVNTWSNRKMFSFSDNSNQNYILGYGVPIEDGKRDNDKFLDVLNSLNESVLELDYKGKFLLFNAAWGNLIGHESEKVGSQYFVDYVHEEDKHKFLSDFVLITQGDNDELNGINIRIKAKTGYLWIELKLAKKGVSDISNRIYCIIKDIDEARKSYEIINELRLAIEDSAEGIAVMNATDQYTYLNKAHIELFGYSHEAELLGKSWKVFYPPEEIERIENEVFPEFMSKGHYRGSTLGVKKDGSYLFQEISLTALPNGGLICVAHNITEELDQQKKLRQLAIVAEKTNSLVLICDKTGRLEWVNQSFEELTGYTLNEIKGMFPSEFLAGEETDPSILLKIQQSVESASSFKGEVLNYSKCGKKFWLYLDITPIKDENNEVQSFIAVENNITAVKDAEEKLIFALNKEKQLNALKSHFVNLVSHEFRTPLATIQSSMDVLQVFSEKENSSNGELLMETLAKHHFRIENEIHRMTKIMDNVLLLGRMDAGKVVFKPERVYLNEIAQEVLEEFNQFGNLPGKIALNILGVPKLNVIDPFLMRQVLVNVLMNAIKYTKNNIQPSILVNYKQDKTIVEVSDHGIGIPEEELSNIFNSFFRASNAQHIQGTGLGLVIVKQLVELHNGTVQIINKQPKGINFIISLPYNSPK